MPLRQLSALDWDVVAGLAASFSVLVAVAAFFVACLSFRVARDSNKLAYFDALRAWADECVRTVQKAIHIFHLCDNLSELDSSQWKERRYELLWTLSSLVDRGRWFFPNTKEESRVNEGKADPEICTAFEGRRKDVLNQLVKAHRIISGIESRTSRPSEIRAELIIVERSFVSIIQEIMDPSCWNKEYRLIEKTR